MQGLASITPYFARVDAVTKFPWSAAYLTREWDPETVYKLLLNNPDLMDPVKRKPGREAAARRANPSFPSNSLPKARWRRTGARREGQPRGTGPARREDPRRA